MATQLTLYGMPGWGSVLIEAQLAFHGVPFTFVETGHLFKDAAAAERLKSINPLAQIPTLVLENDEILTESAAMTLWLADRTGSTDLVPAAADPARTRFLRWLIFITSNIYPTFTYSDVPARFVEMEAAQDGFVKAVRDYAKTLLGQLEREADPSGPYFLGNRFSALDIYVCTLAHWTPGRAWFAEHAPRLSAIADKTLEVPQLQAVWARNFND